MSSIFRILNTNINLNKISEPINNITNSVNSVIKTNLSSISNPFVLNTTKESKEKKSKNKKPKDEPKKIIEPSSQIKNNINTQSGFVIQTVKLEDKPIDNPVVKPIDKPIDTNENNLVKQEEVKKIYWEYGNSGLKIREFGKKMNRNLAILHYIDKIFLCYYDMEDNSLNKLFNTKVPQEYKFGENRICSGFEGIEKGCVNISIDCGKISGTYNVVSASFTLIHNVKIEEKDMVKKKVPFLDNFLSRLDNLKEIIKITNILELTNKFKTTCNSSSEEFNFNNIFDNFTQIKKKFQDDNKEKKLLKSSSDTAFYIKIYEDHGKAFVIDKTNKLIYYMVENEDYKKGTILIRYYCLNITDNIKIKSI
jgi:hypothetical protein